MTAVAALVEHLGVSANGPSPAHLARVRAAWARTVPFDNVRRRVQLAVGLPDDPLAGADLDEFVEDHLTGGAGGLCVPGARALRAVLDHLGYRAHLLRAHLCEVPGCTGRPNHVTVAVELAGEVHLVDTVLVAGPPLATGRTLDRSSRARAAIVVEGAAPLTGRPTWMVVRDLRPCSDRYVDHLYRATQRAEPFVELNRATYIRIEGPDGPVAMCRAFLVETTADRERAVHFVRGDEERRGLLVERFGLSPALVERLPPDDPDG